MGDGREWCLMLDGARVIAKMCDGSSARCHELVSSSIYGSDIPSLPGYIMLHDGNGAINDKKINRSAMHVAALPPGEFIFGPAAIIRRGEDAFTPMTWDEAKRVTAKINEILKQRKRGNKNMTELKVASRNAKLEEGQTYEKRGGGKYRCLWVGDDGASVLNIDSGWCTFAHNVTMYDDGTIEWDYSTGGRFMERE